MGLAIRAEMPIPVSSKILEYKTIGNLQKKYPNLHFTKYIFVDPADNKLKAVNPPSELPLVADAFITLAGDIKDIKEFSKELVELTE